MNKRFIHILIAALMLMLCAASPGEAIEKISPDANAVQVLNRFLQAISLADDHARLAAVVPLVHKSLLTADGTDLDRDTKEFSYKKAWQNVKFYQVPAGITQVHKGNVLTVGFRETAERGRVDKYFVAKKPGINGMPAPIHIFFPENGSAPKIINMGSL
jgi:hypothetical protein